MKRNLSNGITLPPLLVTTDPTLAAPAAEPMDPELLRILGLAMEGHIELETRVVPVASLQISAKDINERMLQRMVLFPPEPTGQWHIPVLVLRDGTLWAFDDAHLVGCWQKTHPKELVPVAIIPWQPEGMSTRPKKEVVTRK